MDYNDVISDVKNPYIYIYEILVGQNLMIVITLIVNIMMYLSMQLNILILMALSEK